MSDKEIILVGVDGSKESQRAVKWAIMRAKKIDARLHILCVYSLPSFTPSSLEGGYAAIDDVAIREGAQLIVDEAKTLVEREGIEVTSSIEVGDPARILVELSSEVSMIVVGKSGIGGFADRLLGSVSSALASHSLCTVVVIPPPEKEVNYDTIKAIVVGVDGSQSSRPALKSAIYEAKVWQAKLTSVMAVPMASGTGMLSWLPATIDKEAILQDVSESLDDLISQELGADSMEITKRALDGNPSALLTEFSEKADLVIVGTRGRGGFTGLLLGSTSQSLLNNAKSPVMVVPSMATIPDIFDRKSENKK